MLDKKGRIKHSGSVLCNINLYCLCTFALHVLDAGFNAMEMESCASNGGLLSETQLLAELLELNLGLGESGRLFSIVASDLEFQVL